ncbi:hypothetical protein CYMTET_26989 [Cymbomonas tetramitiformis]|uniref:Uncharacterized protein n=1 Tax=Cymbomonas tetramitiformis TaxID=36881 RepID=A0AAE0FQM2_9CHLO|nr:hypothetical protein CYMTET_26989 [Cymbomonas tetramitiformis]
MELVDSLQVLTPWQLPIVATLSAILGALATMMMSALGSDQRTEAKSQASRPLLVSSGAAAANIPPGQQMALSVTKDHQNLSAPESRSFYDVWQLAGMEDGNKEFLHEKQNCGFDGVLASRLTANVIPPYVGHTSKGLPKLILQGLTRAASAQLLKQSQEALREELTIRKQLKDLDEEEMTAVLQRTVSRVVTSWLGVELQRGNQEPPTAGNKEAGATGVLNLDDLDEQTRPHFARFLEELSASATKAISSLEPGRSRLYANAFRCLRLAPDEECCKADTDAPQQRGGLQLSSLEAAVLVATLQDASVCIGEAVATSYLQLFTARGWRDRPSCIRLTREALPPWLHSTRAVDWFWNSVAMSRTADRNFTAVIAIYEDRHQLWGFTRAGQFTRRQLPASRHEELQQLHGWPRKFSIILEAADVLIPAVTMLGKMLGNAVSWFLVRFIGRSLGLIYRGVQQSLKPTGQEKKRKHKGSSPLWE